MVGKALSFPFFDDSACLPRPPGLAGPLPALPQLLSPNPLAEIMKKECVTHVASCYLHQPRIEIGNVVSVLRLTSEAVRAQKG